jgi:hypothetical protein
MEAIQREIEEKKRRASEKKNPQVKAEGKKKK